MLKSYGDHVLVKQFTETKKGHILLPHPLTSSKGVVTSTSDNLKELRNKIVYWRSYNAIPLDGLEYEFALKIEDILATEE